MIGLPSAAAAAWQRDAYDSDLTRPGPWWSPRIASRPADRHRHPRARGSRPHTSRTCWREANLGDDAAATRDGSRPVRQSLEAIRQGLDRIAADARPTAAAVSSQEVSMPRIRIINASRTHARSVSGYGGRMMPFSVMIRRSRRAGSDVAARIQIGTIGAMRVGRNASSTRRPASIGIGCAVGGVEIDRREAPRRRTARHARGPSSRTV